MKKLVVLVLALVMVVAMGFANVNGTEGNIDVKVTVLPHVVLELPNDSFDLVYDPDHTNNVDSDSVTVTVKSNYAYDISAEYLLPAGVTPPASINISDYYSVTIDSNQGNSGVNQHVITFTVDYEKMENDAEAITGETDLWTKAKAGTYMAGTVNVTVSAAE